MQSRVTLTSRGIITIPTRMRKAFNLRPNDQLIIEETPDGLLLRPTINLPIEHYTEARIAEFTRDDQAIIKLLNKHPARAKKRR